MSKYFDVEAVRQDFPVTQQFLYFDSAFQAPLGRSVRAGFEDFLDESSLTAGPKSVWLDRIAGLRGRVARLIGADASEIAFTKNTSEGLNIAANAMPLECGDNVVLIEGDHPNNTYSWLNLQRKGVDIRFVTPDPRGFDAHSLTAYIDDRTRAISLSHVTCDTGERFPVADIGALCESHGIPLIVDAMQSLGTMPVDVDAMGISMLASGCHKGLLVPQGLGILYVERKLVHLRPAYLAASAIVNPSRDRRASYAGAALREGAVRFETGNLNLPHLHALDRSLALIERIGVQNISAHVLDLGELLIAELDRLGIRLVGPREPKRRSHILVLDLPGERWLDYLSSRKVRVSQQRGGIRVSFALFNTADEVERLVRILAAGPR